MTASQPIGCHCHARQPAREPDSQAPSEGSRAITVSLSPAVFVILRLVETANPRLTRDEILSRAIGHLAQRIGVPALARDMAGDLADLPVFDRAPINRHSRSGGP